jgi:hypothetical protein
MKNVLMLASCLFGFAVSAGALEIPRTVHRVSAISQATQEAEKGKKGILWVLSDSSLKPT